MFARWVAHEWDCQPRAKRHGLDPTSLVCRFLGFTYREAAVMVATEAYGSNGVGVAEDARVQTEDQEAAYSQRLQALLDGQPVLRSLMDSGGLDAVYVFADLSRGEHECVGMAHHGMDVQEIADSTGRQRRAAQTLIERGLWKLERLVPLMEQAAARSVA